MVNILTRKCDLNNGKVCDTYMIIDDYLDQQIYT